MDSKASYGSLGFMACSILQIGKLHRCDFFKRWAPRRLARDADWRLTKQEVFSMLRQCGAHGVAPAWKSRHVSVDLMLSELNLKLWTFCWEGVLFPCFVGLWICTEWDLNGH